MQFQDFVEYAVFRLGLQRINGPDADPVIKDVRKALRKTVGRREAAAVQTQPGAGAHFAGLLLPAILRLDQVSKALGIPKDETLVTATRLILARQSPLYADLADEIVELIAPFYLGDDGFTVVHKATHAFAERVWFGFPSDGEASIPAAIVTFSILMSLIQIDTAVTRNSFTDPDIWRAPADWAVDPPTESTNAASDQAAPLAHVPESGTGADDDQDYPDLRLLFGDSFETNDDRCRDALDASLAFGTMLSDQIAKDVGNDEEGPWRNRIAVIGFCAALPAVAEALGADALFDAEGLIEITRHVDAASGDGHLIQTLAAGDPQRVLSECSVALKDAIVAGGISVTDEAFALFPLRLAASSEFAERAAERLS